MGKVVFTDGSAEPNPGPGGFAVIDAETGEPVILGRSAHTTNIVMEGNAIFEAMKAFPGAKICTDSQFWVNVMTKWAPRWERDGWWKKGGIANKKLVTKMWDAYHRYGSTLTWVRGHVGTEMNERADIWANNAREGKTYKDLEIIELEGIVR